MNEEKNNYSEAMNLMWKIAGSLAGEHPHTIFETDDEILNRQRCYFVNAFRILSKKEDSPKVSEPVRLIAEIAGYSDSAGIYWFTKHGGKDKPERAAIRVLRGKWNAFKKDGILPKLAEKGGEY
jgi:hypothetical protein